MTDVENLLQERACCAMKNEKFNGLKDFFRESFPEHEEIRDVKILDFFLWQYRPER